MPQSGRAVKERDPKVIKLAMSLVGPSGGRLFCSLQPTVGVSFFPLGLSPRLDPTPLVVALLATALLLSVVGVLLKIESAAGNPWLSSRP